jgi:hypothetical protein
MIKSAGIGMGTPIVLISRMIKMAARPLKESIDVRHVQMLDRGNMQGV